MGYELVPAGGKGTKAKPLSVLRGLEAIYGYGNDEELAFDVAMDACCSYLYFSFHRQGWHPFSVTVRQYLNGETKTYETSILSEFYRRFQPRTQGEAYFEDDGGIDPLSRTPSHYVLEPWLCSKRRFKDNGGHGNQNYGPVSTERGKVEFSRLVRLCHSIKEHGYAPEKFEYIRGFFLKDGDAYRFHVTAGLHKSAILSVLGCSTLRVKFDPRMPRVIDRADLMHWPQVKRGELSPEVADRVFRRFFEENGRTKAKRLGLLQSGRDGRAPKRASAPASLSTTA